MIAFRRAHPILSKEQFYTDAEIQWLGSRGGLPNWTDPKEKRFGCLIHEDAPGALCVIFNAGDDGVDFGLPSVPAGAGWHLQAVRFAPPVIPKSIKNTSENVLVKFACTGDPVRSEKHKSLPVKIGRRWRSGTMVARPRYFTGRDRVRHLPRNWTATDQSEQT